MPGFGVLFLGCLVTALHTSQGLSVGRLDAPKRIFKRASECYINNIYASFFPSTAYYKYDLFINIYKKIYIYIRKELIWNLHYTDEDQKSETIVYTL